MVRGTLDKERQSQEYHESIVTFSQVVQTDVRKLDTIKDRVRQLDMIRLEAFVKP